MSYRELTFKEYNNFLFDPVKKEHPDYSNADVLHHRKKVDDVGIALALKRYLQEPWETKD